MEPQQSQPSDPASEPEPPELEMHKRVVRMPDGKRDMIYFTFAVKHV